MLRLGASLLRSGVGRWAAATSSSVQATSVRGFSAAQPEAVEEEPGESNPSGADSSACHTAPPACACACHLVHFAPWGKEALAVEILQHMHAPAPCVSSWPCNQGGTPCAPRVPHRACPLPRSVHRAQGHPPQRRAAVPGHAGDHAARSSRARRHDSLHDGAVWEPALQVCVCVRARAYPDTQEHTDCLSGQVARASARIPAQLVCVVALADTPARTRTCPHARTHNHPTLPAFVAGPSRQLPQSRALRVRVVNL
jgi:hypothetical protein